MSDVLTTAATTDAVTLTECKRHLNVSSTADDAMIRDYIAAATMLLEKKTNRAFINQTRTLKMRTFFDTRYVHGREMYPPRSPLSSVASISYVDVEGTTTTMPSSDYISSTGDRPGKITEAYNATWPATRNHPNDITVTYVAGHTSSSTGVPANVKQAIRLVVGEWYRNREMGPMEMDVVNALLETEQVETYG